MAILLVRNRNEILDQNNIVALKHGEAVCLDVILSNYIAYNRGFLDINELKRILISKN